jgi:multicomponent K+:H+ antiporter subunit F
MLTVLGSVWSQNMVMWSLDLGILVIVAGIVLCIHRILRGPHLADRALALDTIAIHLIGLVILLTIRFGSLVFFDGALILSLLGFAGTIAVAQYIGRMHLRRKTGRHMPEDVDR